MGETLKVLGDSFSTKRGAESRSSDVTRRRSCGGNWDAIPLETKAEASATSALLPETWTGFGARARATEARMQSSAPKRNADVEAGRIAVVVVVVAVRGMRRDEAR